MEKPLNHFHRTKVVLHHCGVSKEKFNQIAISKVNPTRSIAFFLELLPNAEEDTLEILQGIFLIEKEKISLRNKGSEISKIIEWEKTIYGLREKLLSEDIMTFSELEFQISPYVKTYESHWNWSQEELEFSPHLYSEIINSKKNDFFFLFQQTGCYDHHLDSNILEFEISEYQYFLLHIFEKPTSIASAIHLFEYEFNPSSNDERGQLRDMTMMLIRELIFRIFIIRV